MEDTCEEDFYFRAELSRGFLSGCYCLGTTDASLRTSLANFLITRDTTPSTVRIKECSMCACVCGGGGSQMSASPPSLSHSYLGMAMWGTAPACSIIRLSLQTICLSLPCYLGRHFPVPVLPHQAELSFHVARLPLSSSVQLMLSLSTGSSSGSHIQ